MWSSHLSLLRDLSHFRTPRKLALHTWRRPSLCTHIPLLLGTHLPHYHSRNIGGLEQGDHSLRREWGEQHQQDHGVAGKESDSWGSGRQGALLSLLSLQQGSQDTMRALQPIPSTFHALSSVVHDQEADGNCLEGQEQCFTPRAAESSGREKGRPGKRQGTPSPIRPSSLDDCAFQSSPLPPCHAWLTHPICAV